MCTINLFEIFNSLYLEKYIYIGMLVYGGSPQICYKLKSFIGILFSG